MRAYRYTQQTSGTSFLSKGNESYLDICFSLFLSWRRSTVSRPPRSSSKFRQTSSHSSSCSIDKHQENEPGTNSPYTTRLSTFPRTESLGSVRTLRHAAMIQASNHTLMSSLSEKKKPRDLLSNGPTHTTNQLLEASAFFPRLKPQGFPVEPQGHKKGFEEHEQERSRTPAEDAPLRKKRLGG